MSGVTALKTTPYLRKSLRLMVQPAALARLTTMTSRTEFAPIRRIATPILFSAYAMLQFP